ncbi:MAG TPA: hypothetical protein VHA14_19160 [Bryobacteraceae bacterium]|nr:hypothetical protein [Bryobacteraceae bacterium]
MQSAKRPFWRSPYFWILSVFAVSRIAYYAAGVRFDYTPLRDFFQIADPLLLRTRLFETLLYLHTQPPGFNLLIGLALKLFPSSYGNALWGIYLACGLSLCFTLFRLMRLLGVRPAIAAALTAIFLASPGVVLFENFLMYEYPMMALLCASAVLLEWLLRQPGRWPAIAFFGTLAALMYLRALFHLGWFILIAAAVLWLIRANRRQVFAVAAVAFCFVVVLYAKNAVIVGSFTSSTWLGFNAETITIHQLTDEEHERLIREGYVSPISRISSLDELSKFQGIITMPPPTGIPVLDQTHDSTGRMNYNNIAYLKLHPIYIHDAEEIILHAPIAYVRSVVRAFFTYFLPTGDFTFFQQNGPKIEPFDRAFNIIFFGQWRQASNRKDLRRLDASGGTWLLPLYTGTYLLVGLPLLFGWGVWKVWRAVRERAWRNPRIILLAYILFQIAFMTALVNLLSCFENNRYRLPIDPFFVVLLGMAIERIIIGAQSRSKQTSPTPAQAEHSPSRATAGM